MIMHCVYKQTVMFYTFSFIKPSHSSQAAVSFKISNFLTCICSFDLSCPILEKDNFIENVYIVLYCRSF